MPKISSTTLAHPPLGTLIDNDSLELVEVLGVGGYGVVYRAVSTRAPFPKSYAVKCLVDTQPQPHSRQRQVHIREVTLHQLACAHPNVVTLHRVVEEFNHTYLVMDYASDGDLFSQILHNCRYLGDDYLIKQVFLQLLDAVEYCHSLGIYHRDLKPENVLCFDGGLHVAITDFGLATTDKVSEEFRTGSVYHMSPECQGSAFLPTGSYSPMFNDIWSLAIILLNLATGRNPWKSASASDPTFQAFLQDPVNFLPTVLPISPELNAILVRMLEIDWRHRMTIREIRRAIHDLDNFYSDGVLFEGSMARCPWEAGMDIDSDSSTKGEKSLHHRSQAELKSHWSKESIPETDSDVMFATKSTAEPSTTYEPWPEYPSYGAAWDLESPVSSVDSQQITSDRHMWESPRTPSATRSMTTPSVDSLTSLPATPNGVDSSFGDRVNIASQEPLTLNTDCGRFRESKSVASFSTGSSMMQTAIDYGPYTSSFFLATPASPSKRSMAMPSTIDFGDDAEESKDMDTTSIWENSGTETSYCSVDSGIMSSPTCHEIVCDSPCPTLENPTSDVFVASPPASVKTSAASQLKRLGENKLRGPLFRLFPRPPRSSSSFSRGPMFGRSRTPSPPLKQPWTFTPSRPRTSTGMNTQDGCRRGLMSKRHWFSPGKFFAATAT